MIIAMSSYRGISLIEALIALAISSFMLLALASAQIAGFYKQLATEHRVSASLIARDMATRMQINFVEARKGVVSIYNDPNHSKRSSGSCQGSVANCSVTALAQFDLFQGDANAKAWLPSGTMQVCLDSSTFGACNGSLSGSNAVYSINIKWVEKDGTKANYLLSVRP